MSINKEQAIRALQLMHQSLTILKEELEIVSMDISSDALDKPIQRVAADMDRIQSILSVK